MATNPIRRAQSDSGGYIALISTIIISLILLGLSFEMSSSGFMSRFNVLNTEYKRVSLGLAESCVNIALLKIAQNYNYPGGETIPVGSDTCTISAITPAPPRTGDSTTVAIATKGEFQGAFSNINIAATVQNPNVVYVIPTTLVATLILPTGANLSDFPLTLDGVAITSGQTNTVSSGVGHALNTPVVSGYSTTGWAGACDASGNITPASGSSNSCYINYTVTQTTATLTLIANINPSGGSSVLQIKNNSTGVTETVTSGGFVQVPAGVTYTASATTPAGYQASPWNGVCNGTTGVTSSLSAETNYVCVINFTLPGVACADTVMMMDRTNSTSGFQAEMAAAAKALLNLYKTLSPAPQVGVGDYGDLYGNHHFGEIPTGISPQIVSGLLTSDYGSESTITNTQNSSVLLPSGQGFYTAWTNGEGTIDENDPVNCTASDSINESTTGDRESVKINLSTIPNGSTVKSVQVFAWDVANTVIGGSYQTFVRVGTTNTDSGTNLNTTSLSGCTQRSQNIDIPDFVKGSTSTLEIGVLKTATNISNVRVGAIRTIITYDGPTFISTGLYKTINEIYGNGTSGGGTSNLSNGITVANNELGRTTPINGSNGHDLTKKKVLIFVADGKPDYPDNSITRLLDESDKAKKGPDNIAGNFDDAEIFSIYFGSDTATQKTIMAQVSSGSIPVSGHQPGSDNDKATASLENADNDHFFISPNAAAMAGIVETIGKIVCPAAAGITQATMNISIQVINSNGGIAGPGDFHIAITGAAASPNAFDGSTSGTSLTVTPGGSFDIAVSGPASGYYPPQFVGCSSSGNSVAAGETIYCTIINYDRPPPPTPPLPPPPANIDIGKWEEQPASP